jgi:MoaD family protein
MKIKVKLFSHLRSITGLKEVDLELNDGATLKDVLEALICKFGSKFEEAVKNMRTGEYAPFLIMVGKREVSTQTNLNYEVKDGEEVYLLEPVGGG